MQSMDFIDTDQRDEEEWLAVQPDWWRTSINAAEWSFSPSDTSSSSSMKELTISRSPLRSVFQYHSDDESFDDDPSSSSSVEDAPLEAEEGVLALNSLHIAVEVAQEALRPYEENVGFHYSTELSDLQAGASKTLWDKCSEATEDHVEANHAGWEEIFSNLTGQRKLRRLLDPVPTLTSFSPFNITEESVVKQRSRAPVVQEVKEPIPRLPIMATPPTPKAKTVPPTITDSVCMPSRQTKSCDIGNPSPARRLNATASSFIPVSSSPFDHHSDIPMPHSTPSLHPDFFTVPPIPSVKLQKDEQGFYSGVDEDLHTTPVSRQQAQKSTLLPPFLYEAKPRRRSPASKTRSLVEDVRSASRSSASQSPSPSPHVILNDKDFFQPRPSSGSEQEQDDLDGWIGVTEETKRDILSSVQEKRRSRGLAMVETLARHRSESSLSLEHSKPMTFSDGEEDGESAASSAPPITPSTSSSPSRAASVRSNDGWIEPVAPAVPPPKQKKNQHRRKQNSVPSTFFPTSVPPSFAPNVHAPPFVFGPVPAAMYQSNVHGPSPYFWPHIFHGQPFMGAAGPLHGGGQWSTL